MKESAQWEKTELEEHNEQIPKVYMENSRQREQGTN